MRPQARVGTSDWKTIRIDLTSGVRSGEEKMVIAMTALMYYPRSKKILQEFCSS
jgi:hypothetical protein